jgi:hypothetical protein
MHRLARHPEPPGHLNDAVVVVQDRQHSLIALLHDTQLHQHDDDPLQLSDDGSSPAKKAQHRQARTITRNTGTGASVAQLPEPVREVSPTYRSQRVYHDPGQHMIGGVGDERGLGET